MVVIPEQLPSSYDDLHALCLSLIADNTHLDADLTRLAELLRLARSGRFGANSEQMAHPGMQSLFPDSAGDAEPATSCEPVEIKSYSRQPAPRKPFPDSLPREEVYLDIPEHERTCDCCGADQALKLVSEQTTEKLHVKPAQHVVRRYHRPVYSCPKCETMKAATMPPHPIPKCGVTTETLAGIAVGKYMDALPLYRQEQIFLRAGIDLGRDKMSRWMVQLGERLQPLVDRLHRQIISGDQMCMDETSMQVLKEENRLPTAKGFMLVQARGDPGGRSIVLFQYSPSRSRESIGQLVGDFQGILLTDGLGVYDCFGGLGSGVTHAGCWAHVRRKFMEAQKGCKASSRKGSLAAKGLDFINELFAIEVEAGKFNADLRINLRKEKSGPLIAELKTWLDERVNQVPKKSLIGDAIGYSLRQWPKLIKFLDDGRIPLHNNFVENMIRPFAVGRKNWMFADTPEGAVANANLYSLLVTAKVNGLHPTEYLVSALTGICRSQAEADLDELLPLKPIQ